MRILTNNKVNDKIYCGNNKNNDKNNINNSDSNNGNNNLNIYINKNNGNNKNNNPIDKETIKTIVKNIRRELDLPNIDFEIIDLIYNNNNIIIYTPTRGDKSIIIGPGGWVSGKLRETIKKIYGLETTIIVKDYCDEITYKKLLEKYEPIKKLFDNCDKIYFLVQCQNDINVLDFLINNGYNIKVIILNIGSIVMPNKNLQNIVNYLKEKNIDYDIISKNFEINEFLNQNHSCNICSELFSDYLLRINKNSSSSGSSNNSSNSNNNSKATNTNNNTIIGINNHTLDIIKEIGNRKIKIINLLKAYPFKENSFKYQPLQCPLKIQYLKRNRELKKEEILKIIKKTYLGLIEPNKGSDKILKIWKGSKL